MTRRVGGRTRVRTRLAALLLVPVLGAVGFAVSEAREAARVADRAADVEATVTDARTKLQLRLLLSNEAFSSVAAATTADFGVTVEQFGEILGIDLRARVERDRAAVDAAFAGVTDPQLDEVRETLAAARADEDATAAELLFALSGVQGDVTRSAADAMEEATSASLAVPSATALRRSLDVVSLAHEAATAVGVQLDGLARLLIPSPDEAREAGLRQLRLGLGMLDTNELYLASRASGAAADAWAAARDADFSVRAAEAAEHYAARSVASTPPVPLDVLGSLVQDAMDRIDAYGAFATATAEDAALVAADLHRAELAASQRALAVAIAVIVLGLGPAALFVRSLVSPLRALADRAVRVSAGELTDEPPTRRGPREVVEVGAALDEAVGVLRTVEASLDAMAAGDVDRVADAPPPPGRLGALVHQSVTRLSESVLERERLASRLAHEAAHDTLTGLPNRVSAVGAIAQASARCARAGTGLAVLVVELVGLRTVNATHGHAAGNRVLQMSARRLRDEVRAGEAVARVGASDFAVVAEDLTDPTAVRDLTDRLLAALAEPVGVGAAVTRVGVRIGVAFQLDGAADAEALLRDAGLAADRAAVGGIELFDQSMRTELLEQVAVEERLTAAMAAGELTLHLQPIVTVDGEPVDAEALLRWSRADGSMVPPGQFIPAAEASDLIIDIGRWVLADAAQRLARWQDDPVLARIGISVNLSARHVLSLTVVDDVAQALAAAGVADPRLLTVEVTETAVLSDFDRACEHLDRLRQLGVRIAVDDFGTGYTSLVHLRRLPADVLKVDRSLVVSAAENLADERILELVVAAAHAAGMTVVAEGIETEEQRLLVRRAGCDQAQGFLVARPQPEADLRRLLAERTPA